MIFRRIAIILACLMFLSTAWAGPARAEAPPEPDYAVPGRFVLPWACGDGHVVTWDPFSHWTYGKTVGMAYDFAMPEGAPLYAPAEAKARFLRDERPFESNLGNYVEMVIAGDWVVRYAHLRDEQSGERTVRAGEFLGYAGQTGASAPHLHFELLVREGEGWARPDLARVVRLFGLPRDEFSEGAILAHRDCPAQVTLAGAVQLSASALPLGEALELLIPLRNDGLAATVVRAVQVLLQPPSGAPLLAEVRGEWPLPGQEEQQILVRAWPNWAGTWRVGRIICRTDAGTFSLAEGDTLRVAGQGAVEVQPSPLRLLALSAPPILEVGERLTLQTRLVHSGTAELAYDGIVVAGTRPDGAPWTATSRGGVLAAGAEETFSLRSATLPQQVGFWQITQVGYQREGHTFYLTSTQRSLAVFGPELVIQRVSLYPTPGKLSILLQVANLGTRHVAPDKIVLWGWKPDGEGSFVTMVTRAPVLEPGQSTLVQLETSLQGPAGLWRLVEAGYWARGDYYRMALPTQPVLAVEDGLIQTQPR